jgi:hypothetical protein
LKLLSSQRMERMHNFHPSRRRAGLVCCYLYMSPIVKTALSKEPSPWGVISIIARTRQSVMCLTTTDSTNSPVSKSR